MDADDAPQIGVSRIAAAIGELARARMLFCLMDGRARTGTELAVVANVTPSTASVHLSRLRAQHLVKVLAQGKYRYYSLESVQVARVLEGLSVLAGASRKPFAPDTPAHLRLARTCYDHMAGTLGVRLHDRLQALGWLWTRGPSYDLTPEGSKSLQTLGMDVEAARAPRRQFAFGCLDWSERRFHVGGSLGAELLKLALQRQWVAKELDSRSLLVTRHGRREMASRLGLEI